MGEWRELEYELYQNWMIQNEWDAAQVKRLGYEPLVSVVIPVYNVQEKQLTECIESVRKQTYANWELILVDDHSSWPEVKKTLQRYEGMEKITVVYRETNGNISEATNTGLELVRGEFTAFVDCDDTLAVNAFYEFAKALNARPELDFLYSDEDKLSADGKTRHSPFFKPDWSPDTFLSLMYTNHLALYRTALVKKTGGLRTAFNGAQDYDFTLRFMELTDNARVCHVSKVLYNWRERSESTSVGLEVKPYVREAVKKIKEEVLKRRSLDGEIEFVSEMGQYRVVYRDNSNPLVSVIIPSKDHFELLKQCIDSVCSCTVYANYEFIVVDNGSAKEEREKIEAYLSDKRAVYHYQEMGFNFSKMCNQGAALASGEYLLFLNDDIECFQADWLGRMVGHASLDYVGAVGAKLYYPNSKRIQHAGIIISERHGPIVPFGGMEDNMPYYFGRNRLEYNVIAVTGACLMVNRRKFEECGGFDEGLAVAYNDVELCMKLYEAGYYNVIRNDVILYHHESISRGIDFESGEKMARLARERGALFEKHPQFRREDPFYNRNLTGDRNDFRIRENELKEISKSESGELKRVKRARTSECMEIYIDAVGYSANRLIINGWGFAREFADNNATRKYLLIEAKENRKERYLFACKTIDRPDVAKVFAGTMENIGQCGYEAVVPSEILNPRNCDYQISLVLRFGNQICRKTYPVSLNRLTNAREYLDEGIEHIEKRRRMDTREDIYSEVATDQIRNGLMIHGWAFCEENNSGYYKRVVMITPSGYMISKAIQPEKRLDIARRFIRIPHISDCGFHCLLPVTLLERLEEGTELGLMFVDKRNPEQRFFKRIEMSSLSYEATR